MTIWMDVTGYENPIMVIAISIIVVQVASIVIKFFGGSDG